MPLINEIKQQAGQRRKASRRKSRPSRKGKAYAAYVPEDTERQVTEIYPEDYDAKRMVIIGHDRSEHLCLRPSSFYVRVEDRIICRLKDARPTDAYIEIIAAYKLGQAKNALTHIHRSAADPENICFVEYKHKFFGQR